MGRTRGGSVGLTRLVVRRMRADWPLVLAAWCLLLAAVGLLSAASSYADVVASDAISGTLAATAPADRAVSVRIPAAPRSLAALDRSVTDRLAAALAVGGGGDVIRIARASALVLAGAGTAGQAPAVTVASYAGLDRHATLADGRWPVAGASPTEATLSVEAAAGLGVGVGQEVRLADSLDPTRSFAVRIVGTWRTRADDPYWLGDRGELEGVQVRGPFTVHGPVVVPDADLGRFVEGSTVDAEWRALPAADRLTADRLDPLAGALATLPGDLAALAPPGTSVQVTDGLAPVLARLARSVLVSRTGQLLVALQFALLAAYAIVLVAGVLDDRRRDQVALLRARGVRTGDLARMALTEALLLAASATLVAPLLAAAVVAVVAGAPAGGASRALAAVLAPGSLAVAVAAGVVAGGVTALPTLVGLLDRGPIQLRAGRGLDRTLPQRIGLDLALLVLALVGLWQLRAYGAPLTRDVRGALGIDPVVVGAPAIGLVAGAVLAIRLVPRLGELAERVLARRSGAVAALGGRQLGRRPLRTSRSALLLVLAFGLGSFTLTDAATWRGSQADQAAYEAVADVRVVTADYPTLPDADVGSAYRGVRGVTAAVPVLRQPLSAGQALRDGTLLGVDPGALARLAPSAPAVPAAAGPRADSSGIAIPGRPAALVATLDAGLHAVPFPGSVVVPPTTDDRGIVLALVVRDGDGLVHRLAAASPALLAGAGQRIEFPLSADAPGLALSAAAPLALIAVEVGFETSDFVPRAGTVVVSGLAARDASGTLADVALGGAAAWRWAISDPASRYGWAPAGPVGLRLDAGDEQTANAVADGVGFRLAALAPSGDPLPALASPSFLAAAGAAIGDVITVRALARPLLVRIAATAERFAPLDPASPWLVVDGPALDAAEFAQDGSTPRPAGWWLGVEPGSEPAVLARLADPAYGAAQAIGRQATFAARTADPVALGLIGALVLGTFAALAFAAIGFVVSAAAATRERAGEFALLRALGLSGRQLASWQSFEQLFLLGLGAGAGIALGIGLAWLVVPAATFTAGGEPPVPPAALVVPWPSFGPVALVAVGLLAATLLVVTRQLRATAIASVLRTGDE